MVKLFIFPGRSCFLAVIFAAALTVSAFGGGIFPVSMTTAHAAPGSGSDGTPEDAIEDDIEDDIVDDLEDEIEDSVEESINDDLEDNIEDRVEDSLASAVEDRIEDDILDKSGPGGGDLDDEIEDEIEDRIEDRLDDKGGSSGKLEDDVEARIEQEAEDHSGRGRGDDDLDEDIEDDASDDDSGRNRGRNRGDDDEDEDDEDHSGQGKSGSDDEDENEDEDDGEDEEDSGQAAMETFELGFDDDGNPVRRDEWLLLLEPEAFQALSSKGFSTKRVKDLDGLGLVLARVEPPEHRNLNRAIEEINAVAPGAHVDFNHLYETESGPVPAAVRDGRAPGSFEGFRLADEGANQTIGLIDTSIDTAHPALAGASIELADFVPYAGIRPTEHGSAVASILVGHDGDFEGVAPKAKILAASVFFESSDGVTAATTASLVEALDWFARANVHVVNMSLAGPPNGILEAAIRRAAERKLTVIAAVGNDGPAAEPRYPAAYPDVIAVTAVDKAKKIYRLANRGDHVDFAAPGVGVMTASPGGGYGPRSGTSFAAPFVAAMLARSSKDGAGLSSDRIKQLKETAEDLGAPGFDPVYGNGYFHMINAD